MIPTIGRVVLYNTTEKDREKMRELKFNVQEQLPAIIVSTWGPDENSAANLNVLYDGVGTFWITSSTQGTAEGQWIQPPRI